MAGAGNGISLVAFPWLVLQRNGSALDASIVAMAGTLPLLVATLIAGAAVDYLGPQAGVDDLRRAVGAVGGRGPGASR